MSSEWRCQRQGWFGSIWWQVDLSGFGCLAWLCACVHDRASCLHHLADHAATHCCNARAGLLAVLGGRSSTRAAACRLCRACVLLPSGKGAAPVCLESFSPDAEQTSGVCKYSGVGKPRACCSMIWRGVLSARSAPRTIWVMPCAASSTTTASW